jgi:DnaJ-class molecular chaperone
MKFKKKHIGVRVEPRKCTACSGSGIYDHSGSPKCQACNGTGLAPIKEEGGSDEKENP